MAYYFVRRKKVLVLVYKQHLVNINSFYCSALSLLCERSVHEDEFGCVQRDMAAILGEMVELYKETDAHERLCAATGWLSGGALV